MKHTLKVTVLALAAILTACGGKATKPTPGQPLDPQGNWLFTFSGANGTMQLGGQLYELTSPVVTSNGFGSVGSTGCSGSMLFNGQASGTNTITLAMTETSAPNGLSASYALTGTIAQSQTAMSGTWTSSNTNDCSLADTEGSWTAQLLAPVNGSYSGTESNGATITAAVTENTDQTSATMGEVSGTVSFNPSSCFAGPLNLDTLTVHVGETLVVNTAADANGASLSAVGTVTTDGKTIAITQYTVSGGACNGLTGTASLVQ